MSISGAGIFYDGVTGARHDVSVDVASAALRISSANGDVLAEWPYPRLERLSATAGVLRLGRKGSDVLARLEIRNPALIAAVGERSSTVDLGAASEGRERIRVVAWSLAAVVSLMLVGVFGVPFLAAHATPLIPFAVERHLGRAVDTQLRSLLDEDHVGSRFECGTTANENAGRVALDKLVRRLVAAADLKFPLTVTVLRRSEANAMALPGGWIYVFRGLIAKSDTPDELASVIAHEIGHVNHRDGTRTALESAGLSLLFGMLLGDFTGGGAVVVAAKITLQLAYSREVEAAADAYSVTLMSKTGGNPRALGTILARIGGATEPAMKILLDHPETKTRIATIDALAGASTGAALLDAAEWTAVKQICSGNRRHGLPAHR
jgi:Zn-dependent protease with chaperone function